MTLSSISRMAFAVVALSFTALSLVSTTTIQTQAAGKLQAGNMAKVISKQNLNIRKSPCGPVIDQLYPTSSVAVAADSRNGTVCKINGVYHTFYNVFLLHTDSGVGGFVSSRYLDVMSRFNIWEGGTPDVRVTTNGTRLYVRSTPCGKVTGSLANNSRGKLVGEYYEAQECSINGDWHMFVKGNFNGKIGFVSAQYLRRG